MGLNIGFVAGTVAINIFVMGRGRGGRRRFYTYIHQ
jgi:hypothetical protein